MAEEGNVLSPNSTKPSPQSDEDHFISGWLAQLWNQVEDNLSSDAKAKLLKGCALAHYQHLNMDQTIAPYQGNLPAFLRLLTEMWHWKIEYDEAAGVITADENKNFCVCPLVQRRIIPASSTLCSCSEGFAEQMFSTVLQKPVTAKVVKSILRGDSSCIYTIQIL